MTTKVVMEALSPTMEEGRLVEWKKQEGDTVAVGDVLAEVETDKAVMELVARAAGTLLKHVVEAGATVPVSELVAVIGEPGEDVSGAAGQRGSGEAEVQATGSGKGEPAGLQAARERARRSRTAPDRRPPGSRPPREGNAAARPASEPWHRTGQGVAAGPRIAAERGLDLGR